ncbi:KUP/HAK/KT family potassium transporter [Kocuria sp. CPCC 205297]|uniref:KUP/HAK/KT family potassium transporter n=1 Tax=Kocuria sp. CPCC 205297 TaxID=3073558 RepID=UPI0034D5E226
MARVHAPHLIPDPLLLGVLVLLVVFRSSEQLAIVYGLAVTGTFLLTTTPFLVYAHPNTVSTPLALSENARFNRVIHEKVFIVRTVPANVPHLAPQDAVTVDRTGADSDHITQLTLHYGFLGDPDVPAGPRIARDQGVDTAPGSPAAAGRPAAIEREPDGPVTPRTATRTTW